VPAEFATVPDLAQTDLSSVPDSLLPYAIRFSSCQILKQNTAGHALTCHFVLFCKASKKHWPGFASNLPMHYEPTLKPARRLLNKLPAFPALPP
jgi:hypothetical protein